MFAGRSSVNTVYEAGICRGRRSDLKIQLQWLLKGQRCPVCVYISLSGVCAGHRNLFLLLALYHFQRRIFSPRVCVMLRKEGGGRGGDCGGCFLLSAPDSIPSGQPGVCPSLLFFMLRVNKREEFPARGLIPRSSWPGDNKNLFTPKIAASAISRGGLQFVHVFSLLC